MTTPTRIKVIKCDNPDWWYASRIGEEFEVTGQHRKDYKVKTGDPDPRFSENFIGMEDCIPVTPAETGEDVAMRAAEEIVKLFELKYSNDKHKCAEIIRIHIAPLEQKARLADELADALTKQSDDTDYCYACDCHPSSGHSPKCPITKYNTAKV